MIGATSFGYWKGCFQAMGSPCELLVDTTDGAIAREALALARGEVTRIEQKYSRFRDDSLVAQLNRGKGSPVVLDDETAALIDLADGLHKRSDGRFDITCGLLGRAWSFDGRPCEPKAELIASLLERVGWSKVTWESPRFWLPEGMEIDLGGIGKEYAADRVAGLLAKCGWDALVNLGGDVVATGPRQSGDPWLVGVAPVTPMEDSMPQAHPLLAGALATSGDTHRYVIIDGQRRGHILDPRTGWPLENAPRQVSVRAETCTTAGALAQLAMLEGLNADRFLAEQGVEHWCLW